jgi:hypothetical protein
MSSRALSAASDKAGSVRAIRPSCTIHSSSAIEDTASITSSDGSRARKSAAAISKRPARTNCSASAATIASSFRIRSNCPECLKRQFGRLSAIAAWRSSLFRVTLRWSKRRPRRPPVSRTPWRKPGAVPQLRATARRAPPDSLRVLELLENPPPALARLVRAAASASMSLVWEEAPLAKHHERVLSQGELRRHGLRNSAPDEQGRIYSQPAISTGPQPSKSYSSKTCSTME